MVNIKSKKGFFFDLDGTLVDSLGCHEAAFKKVLARRHPKIAKTFVYELHSGKATPHVFRELGITDEKEIESLTKEKRNAYLDDVKNKKVPVFPGSKELLQLLHSKGKTIYIVTSAGKENAEAVIAAEGFNVWVKGIVTSQEVKHNKPHPDIFLLTLKRSGLDPSMTVAVEDSHHGKTAAQKAGLDCFLVNQKSVKDPAKEFLKIHDLYVHIKNELLK